MLVPAILYKEEIEKEFAKVLYTKDYFYYSGYAHCNSLTEIRAEDNNYQYAIVDNEKLIGYLAYRINTSGTCAYNFELYSFDMGNCIVGKDLFEKMEELVSKYHRVEWRMIGGNPVQKHYDRFCKKHGGNCVVLHDVTKDDSGNYHDEYIYEIVANS
jgi:hypothetical protein